MTALHVTLSTPQFGGPAYDAALDGQRLGRQIRAIFELMKDGAWRSLGQIAAATGYGEASISAQLRHLRKPEFGAFVVEKERRGDPTRGHYVYRVLPPLPREPDLFSRAGA